MIGITPEVIQATLTGIPVLLAAWWLLLGLGMLWRRWIWREAGEAVRGTAEALRGEVRPRWTGWRVEAEGVRVDWLGGLRVRTRIRSQGGREQIEGLAGRADVLERLGVDQPPGAPSS